nr:hypothetical protein [Tanacetum cinerariifolium]
MDLLSFIRTADPTKVRVAERQHVENEPRFLESTVRRVVLLLSIAPAHASSELEASVNKLLDEGATLLQPRRQRKRKTDVSNASRPSHPPKKLREDYGALGGASIVGKYRSSISATPEREDKSPADSWSATNGFGLDDSRICREMLDEFAPLKFFASVRRMDHDKLFIKFNVGSARQISLSVEAELLKVRDGEIESLKAQLLLKELEAAKAIHLRDEVFKFEATEKSLQGEVGVLRDHIATLEREKNELGVKVTDLSVSVKVSE